MSGCPEGAEQQGGVADGAQAAAAHVADEDPGAVVGGARGRVQVSTQIGFLIGGDVEAGDPQRAGARGQRPQQHALCRRGH
ncbi:hypothetical protein [Streptomyces sp. NPDC004267]|uniref:hypothetical protein n=1 Tax=Streptomyces sp. NPDC004267 TaxID=3364694 RepID=UPI0036D1E474